MHFKHPELFYFLFLLVIPILVHLFQLRRFKKEYFTNVRFLKELSIQTRKSSKIKKWLLLATRLAMLTALIFAFTQPYFESKDAKGKQNELFIILDNSFSMQAKGSNGPLLKSVIQDLLEHTPENMNFSLITNNEEFWNTDIKSVQKELQQLQYSAIPFDLESAITKIKSRKNSHNKDLIILTDAQNITSKELKYFDESLNPYLIVSKSEQKSNVAVDSVFIQQTTEDFYELGVHLKAFGEIKNPISVALYEGKKLISKSQYNFSNSKKNIAFTIPKNDFNGTVSLIDGSLEYDNTYYFSISKPKKIKVLAIGTLEKNDFLSRIYTSDEFEFTNTKITDLNYNLIEKQDVIILNELDNLPSSLQTTLHSFSEKGGNLILIPSLLTPIKNLNDFLQPFTSNAFGNIQDGNKLISKIAFQHPLFQSVFEKKIDNFQYPSTKKSFSLKINAPSILSYSDQSVFLTGIKNKIGSWTYVFNAPLNKENSNFQQAPLIVPTFYKMGQSLQKTGVNAYTIGQNQTAILEATLAKDEILTVKNDLETFIPIQQALSNKVKINFNDYPEQAGNFKIFKQNQFLQNVSFNYPRTESNTLQEPSSALDEINTMPSVENVFNTLHTLRTDSEVWKWFVIFTLLFLVLEILIQKFVK